MGVDLTICVTMGVVSAIFGGLIRDVICQDKPLVMKGQVYTLSVIIGAWLLVSLLILDIVKIWQV